VIKGAARAEAVWPHLACLLGLLDTAGKAKRGMAAQHITNICHGQYAAAQAGAPAFDKGHPQNRLSMEGPLIAAVDADLETLRATLDIADFIPLCEASLTSAGLHGALDRLDADLAREGDDVATCYNAAITRALKPLDSANLSPATPQEPAIPSDDAASAIMQPLPTIAQKEDRSLRSLPPPATEPSEKAPPSTTMPAPAPAPACILPASQATVATMTTLLRRSTASKALSWRSFELRVGHG
jgi:hypothetical protein